MNLDIGNSAEVVLKGEEEITIFVNCSFIDDIQRLFVDHISEPRSFLKVLEENNIPYLTFGSTAKLELVFSGSK